MKTMYTAKYRKHEIHKVDCNRRIVLEEVDVEEFAVKLMMCDPMPALETFRGEVDRYFEQLEGRRGSDIEMSDLIDKKNRVTFVTAIAGSGKSVLVKQMTHKWAKGELFNDFKVCITFECRELNYFALHKGTRFEKDEIFIEFIKSQFNFDVQDSKTVLFIADGIDELKDICQKTSIIGQLIDLKKSKYPESKIIITGRPHIENMLIKHGGGNMGSLRKVEIIGLSDEQIDAFIHKLASSDKERIAKINKAKEISKTSIKFLSVPQFLSSFCCVALLSDKTRIRNAAELYCWSFYLLLRQHADKDGSRDRKIPDIFNEYSEDLLVLSKICHELLNENSIIFEGNIESHFGNICKGKKFLSSLFVDVSDNFTLRMQFKHLTLMEFLSAIYVCTTQNRREISKVILEKRSYQVLFFYCQLMSGLIYEGIIKHLFTNAVKLKESDAKSFFCNILASVREYVSGNDEPFRLSIDVIMCLMNKDVISKQFILSIVNQLSFKKVGEHSSFTSVRKLIEMMKPLRDDFECSDDELKKAFGNVHFGLFGLNELNDLKYAKFLASVDWIRLNGEMATMTMRDIRQEIDGINEWVKVKRVDIWRCNLEDEDVDDKIAKSYKLEWLGIDCCYVTEQGFFNLLMWMITCEKFTLSSIENIKVEWWNALAKTIANSKKKNGGVLALKELVIRKCPLMNDEIKEKVITFIPIDNYSSFILREVQIQCECEYEYELTPRVAQHLNSYSYCNVLC